MVNLHVICILALATLIKIIIYASSYRNIISGKGHVTDEKEKKTISLLLYFEKLDVRFRMLENVG